MFERYAGIPEFGAATRAALAGKRPCQLVELGGRVLSIAYTPEADHTGAVRGVIGVAYDVTGLHCGALQVAPAKEIRALLVGRKLLPAA